MAAIVWDETGSRRYETGVDRGVLFSKSSAVPWNGLVSVTVNDEQEVKAYYQDGAKYLERSVPGDFNAKLTAFTYPEELEEHIGMVKYSPGVFLHDQPSKAFSLAYRTLIGNDVDGYDHGYKLHVVYNVLADFNAPVMGSLSDRMSLTPFEWTLSGTPPLMYGARPTCHVSFNSLGMDPDRLKVIEDTLYGTDLVEPSLPSIVDLLLLSAPLE